MKCFDSTNEKYKCLFKNNNITNNILTHVSVRLHTLKLLVNTKITYLNMVMMLNIDYKFNKSFTLALNSSSIRILHSLTIIKLAILNTFFFYVNFTCAIDKTSRSSKLFFNLLAVTQGSLIVIVKSSTWSLVLYI